MKNEEKIYLTKEGYKQFKNSIETMTEELNELEEKINYIKREEGYSVELEELIYLRDIQYNHLSDRLLKLNKIVICDSIDKNETINIGDVVRIKTYYLDGEEEEVYELVAGDSDYTCEIEKLSIDSPKGKVLYNSNIGDTKQFLVGKHKINVDILEKVNTKKLTRV